MTYLFYCYLRCLWRPATYTAQCAKLDLSCPRTKKFCGNRRERRNKIKVKKKKTEKCVDRVIFCCTCSILYVSYYVRNHWCLLFLVGGEERFLHRQTRHMSSENLTRLFYFSSFQSKSTASLARQCYLSDWMCDLLSETQICKS